jgi:hypothetical protein
MNIFVIHLQLIIFLTNKINLINCYLSILIYFALRLFILHKYIVL